MKGSIASRIAIAMASMASMAMPEPIQATGTDMRKLDRKMAKNSLRGLRRTIWPYEAGTYVSAAGKRRMKDRVLQYAARSNEIQGLSNGEKRKLGYYKLLT